MLTRLAAASILALGLVVAAAAEEARPDLVGTWQLVSRVDRNQAGMVVPETSLGANPSGYLVYDATGHVFLQMMVSDRKEASCAPTSPADTNNLAHVGGYDAYFGRYEVDTAKRIVTHVLQGALGPADVGRRLTRRYHLDGDTLTLQMEPGGEHFAGITRTLVWHRVARPG